MRPVSISIPGARRLLRRLRRLAPGRPDTRRHKGRPFREAWARRRAVGRMAAHHDRRRLSRHVRTDRRVSQTAAPRLRSRSPADAWNFVGRSSLFVRELLKRLDAAPSTSLCWSASPSSPSPVSRKPKPARPISYSIASPASPGPAIERFQSGICPLHGLPGPRPYSGEIFVSWGAPLGVVLGRGLGDRNFPARLSNTDSSAFAPPRCQTSNHPAYCELEYSLSDDGIGRECSCPCSACC